MITFSAPLLFIEALERPSSHAARSSQCGEYRAQHAHNDLNHRLPTFFFHSIFLF